jgi:hypothetical protein
MAIAGAAGAQPNARQYLSNQLRTKVVLIRRRAFQSGEAWLEAIRLRSHVIAVRDLRSAPFAPCRSILNILCVIARCPVYVTWGISAGFRVAAW